MSEYTPTTQQVRREYVSGRAEAESTYPGAPERTTRAAAERDMCRHRQEQTR